LRERPDGTGGKELGQKGAGFAHRHQQTDQIGWRTKLREDPRQDELGIRKTITGFGCRKAEHMDQEITWLDLTGGIGNIPADPPVVLACQHGIDR